MKLIGYLILTGYYGKLVWYLYANFMTQHCLFSSLYTVYCKSFKVENSYGMQN